MTSRPKWASMVFWLIGFILLAAGLVMQKRDQDRFAVRIDDLNRQLDAARADLARVERACQAKSSQPAADHPLKP